VGTFLLRLLLLTSARLWHLSHEMPLYCSWRCTVCSTTFDTTVGADVYQVIPEDNLLEFTKDDLAVPKEFFNDKLEDCLVVGHPNGYACVLVPIPCCPSASQDDDNFGAMVACKAPMHLETTFFHLCGAECDKRPRSRDRSRSPALEALEPLPAGGA